MDILVILAQAGPDPISGGAGWVGAGLLGAVLTWLLFIHLPAKDKQMKEMIDGKDRTIEKVIDSKDALVAVLTDKYEKKLESFKIVFEAESKGTKAEFKETLNSILAHCEKETKELIDAFRTEMVRVTDQLQKMGGIYERDKSDRV